MVRMKTRMLYVFSPVSFRAPVVIVGRIGREDEQVAYE